MSHGAKPALPYLPYKAPDRYIFLPASSSSPICGHPGMLTQLMVSGGGTTGGMVIELVRGGGVTGGADGRLAGGAGVSDMCDFEANERGAFEIGRVPLVRGAG